MTVSELCPLCAAGIGESKSINVCAHCYGGLQANPPVALSTTGEFPAMTDPTLSTPPALNRAPNPDSDEVAACCWCSKTSEQVKKLLSQGDYHICNECVALCADILRMELGDDFG